MFLLIIKGVETMKEDILLDKFQYTVEELLIRNKSILDIITKLQDSCSSINRAVVKSVTHCGCCKITAQKQEIDQNLSFSELKGLLKSHLEGTLCNSCKDIVEKEIGQTLFYMASLCNILNLNMYDIMIKELDKVQILGNYNLR